MQAVKKPIPVDVTRFDGFRDITTLEGIVYKVDGATHYILTGPDGEQWPIDQEVFDKTYVITNKFKIKEKIEEPTIEKYKKAVTDGFYESLQEMFDEYTPFDAYDALRDIFGKTSSEIPQEVWNYVDKFERATQSVLRREDIVKGILGQLKKLITEEMEMYYG